MPAHFEPIVCEGCGTRVGGIMRWYRDGTSFEQRSPYESAVTVVGGGPVAVLKGFTGRPLTFADQRACLELLWREGYERVAWERASGLCVDYSISLRLGTSYDKETS